MTSILKTYFEYVKAPTFHRSELMSIQWLRGFAVVMVLIYHVEDLARTVPDFANFHSFWMRFGYSAPDLFFVISGFIMSYVTFGMKFEPKRWLISRFIRIYPVYIFFTAIACTVWLIAPSMTMGSGEHTWGTVLKSFLIFPQDRLPLIFVGWTVEHEIVFYALVFLVASFGGGLRGLLWVTGILSFLGAARWLVKDDIAWINFWDYHFLSLYMIEFFMGVLCFRYRESLQKLGFHTPLMAAIVLFIAGGLFATSAPINQETLPRVLLFGSSFCMLMQAALNWEVARRAKVGDAYPPKKRPLLVQIGDASYSVYLLHPFVLSAGGKILAIMGLSGIAALVGVVTFGCATIICGLIFYTLIEKPFLQSMKGVMSGKKDSKKA